MGQPYSRWGPPLGRPYARELQSLGDTLDWALGTDIGAIREFVDACHRSPLLAVGSGGSATAAHFAALLHRHLTRSPSRHATPLELLLGEPGLANSAVLVLSASGRNSDVLAAVRVATQAEVPCLGSISTQRKSPLARDVSAYTRGFAFVQQLPSGKDGFLATNSLLGTLVVLARGYKAELASVCTSPDISVPNDIAGRGSAIVLHAGWSSPIATDLESRMHESTLLNVQVSDYRNFGHGRHLWLSRRGDETVVLALITPETASLAERTLRLVPKGIPVLRLATAATGPAASIELLCASLHWTALLAELHSLDPGRPHVPTFGRQLFHVRPPSGKKNRLAAPVQRKLGRFGADASSPRRIYEEALDRFNRKLGAAEIGAVALDYDGTLCETQDRFGPLPEEMSDACSRLLGMGLLLGVATGRGRSVREALRAALAPEYWPSVIIGYYNGADVAPLTSLDAPDKSRPEDKAISTIKELLARDPMVSQLAQIDVRPSQITVSSRPDAPRADLHLYLLDLIQSVPVHVRLLRSGHSIDIVPQAVSKLRVVERLEEAIGPRSVLCIGDRGAWPGNDSHLLGHDISLSVEQVSATLTSCWNLAPSGVLGPRATLRYLNAITACDGVIRVDLQQIAERAP